MSSPGMAAARSARWSRSCVRATGARRRRTHRRRPSPRKPATPWIGRMRRGSRRSPRMTAEENQECPQAGTDRLQRADGPDDTHLDDNPTDEQPSRALGNHGDSGIRRHAYTAATEQGMATTIASATAPNTGEANGSRCSTGHVRSSAPVARPTTPAQPATAAKSAAAADPSAWPPVGRWSVSLLPPRGPLTTTTVESRPPAPLGTKDLSAPGDRQSGVPPRRSTMSRWVDRRDIDSAALQDPRHDGVGVPHLARVELVAAPYRGRYRWQQIEDSSGNVDVASHADGTPDCLIDIGNLPVPPAPDLVTEDSKTLQAPQSDWTLRHDTSPFAVQIRNWCLFDREVPSGRGENERRVVEIAAITTMNEC